MIRRWLLLLWISLALTSCGDVHPDYSGTLPKGYRIVRPDTFTVVIFGPSGRNQPYPNGSYGIAVAAKVQSLGVHKDFVYGYVESSPSSDESHRETPGYFVIDTMTHQVITSLAHSEFEDILKERGVSTIQLRDPESFSE